MKLIPWMLLVITALFFVGCKAKIPTVDGRVGAEADKVEITVSWPKSEGAVSYRVFRGSQSGQESIQPVATECTDTSWIDHDVKKGMVYFYKVAGVNQDGVTGEPSLQEASAKLLKDPPLFDSEISTSADNAVVRLSWTTDLDAVSYRVYRGLKSGAENSKPVASGITETIWTDKNVVNGVTYYYKMASVDSDGEVSPLSASEGKATPYFAVRQGISEQRAKVAFNFSPAGKIKICYTTNSCSQTNYRLNSVHLTLLTASGKFVCSFADYYPSAVTWGPDPDVVRVWRVPKRLAAGSYVLKLVVTAGDYENYVTQVEILPTK